MNAYKDNNWNVYIVLCSDNTLYCGVSNDVDRRVKEHNKSTKGAKYTSTRRPVSLVYVETGFFIGDALKRERKIKKMKKSEKLLLISKKNMI